MKHRSRPTLGLSFLLLASAFLPGALPASARLSTDRLSPENRLAIVRALSYEYATVQKPLPASQKEEEALVVDSTGAIDENKLRQDLANRGAAVHSGDVVQITDIDFKDELILFEINGGGKKNKKWYERIRVQAGSGTIGGTPYPREHPPPERGSNVPGFGSWIVLKFADRVPDVPPDQVKKMLAAVLDFSRRSPAVPWIETIPEEFREAIKEKRAMVGMDREMVLAALGRPLRKVRERKNGQETEDWIYGNPPFVTFVTFVDDKVVEVKEFR